jgi:hypothetical protein
MQQRSPRSSPLSLVLVSSVISVVCTLFVTEYYRQYMWGRGSGGGYTLPFPSSPTLSSPTSSSSSSSTILTLPASVLAARHAQQPAAAAAAALDMEYECEACPACPACPKAAAAAASPGEEVEFECEACPEPAAAAAVVECPSSSVAHGAAAAAPPAAPPAAPNPPSSSDRPPAHRDPPQRLTKRPARRPPPELDRNECVEVDPYGPDLDFPLSASRGRSAFNSPFSATNSAFEEFTGEVLLGECSCPIQDPPEGWSFDCGDYDWRILSELSSPWWQMNFTHEAIDTAWDFALGNVPPTYHYAVRDGKFFRKVREPQSSWGERLADMLRTVAATVRLPDVEFSVNYFDHAKVHRQDPFPVFGFVHDAAMHEIATPHAHFWTNGNDYSFPFSAACPEYGARKDRLFWRGACTGPTHDHQAPYASAYLRTAVTQMTHRHPDLLDAGVSRDCFPDRPGLVDPLPFANMEEDMCMHKNLLLLDGNSISGRSSYMLHSGSTIFKPDSVFSEWSYHLLKPWVHYVPVRENLDDLVEQVQWAQLNPKSAECIARNAKRFAEKHIRKETIACVWWRLLTELARKQPGGSRTEGLSPV